MSLPGAHGTVGPGETPGLLMKEDLESMSPVQVYLLCAGCAIAEQSRKLYASDSTHADGQVFLRILSVIIVLLLFGATVSCRQDASSLVNKSVVQVWIPASAAGESATRVSSGVIVGNGSQVLTLMNYEEYSPGPLEVVTRDRTRYEASIKAIDPRTGITLLQLEGASGLPVASIGTLPQYNDTVFTWGWSDSDWAVAKSTMVISEPAPGALFFRVDGSTPMGPALDTGTVVSDRAGKIIGLATPLHLRLAIRLANPPPIIAGINSGRELLKPDVPTPLWADGPAHSAIAGSGFISGDFAGVLPPPSDYEQMTLALKDLLGTVGQPVVTADLNLNEQSWYASLDGTMLVVVYPRPVDLRSSDGRALASAKWVGIQWGRSEGKPNRLVYGIRAYTIDGGFELLGDLTDLQRSVPPPGTPAIR